MNMDKNIDETVTISGDVTSGDVITLTVADWRLSGGAKAITYTVQSGDDPNSIAVGLSAAVNGDVDLQAINIGSISFNNSVTLQSLSYSFNSYQLSTSAGATENPVLASNAQTWKYEYNLLSKITKSIDPVGRTFSYVYDSNEIDLVEKRETKGTDNYLMGHWDYADPSAPHRPTTYVDGSGQHTQYTYNALTELESITDPNGNVTNNSYDSSGYLTQIDGPLAGAQDVTNFLFFGSGSLHKITNSDGYQIVFSYDKLNRETEILYPDLSKELTVYDKLDPVLKSDRLGRWTQMSYDNMDNLVSIIDPLGRKTKYSWCVCGGIMSISDPLHQLTKWSRDLNGRVTTKTYADGSSTSYTYESISGRLATRTDAAGQVTVYSYNPDNTTAQKSYTNSYIPRGPTSYHYDPAFPRLLVADNSTDWGYITNTYNAYITNVSDPPTTGAGRIASVISSNNWVPNSTVRYQYDELGRLRTRSVDESNNSTSWSYDAMDRMTSETNELGLFTFKYVNNDPLNSKGDSRLSGITYPNGQNVFFEYYTHEGDQRLKQIRNLSSSSETLSQFGYRYNSAGEITQWSQLQNDKSILDSIEYDSAGQLVNVKGFEGVRGQALLTQNNYFYDKASNISGMQRNVVTKILISGSVTTGDEINITVHNDDLSSGSETVTYVVQPGDSLASIAKKLAGALTDNPQFQTIGVNAAPSGNCINVQSVAQNVTTFSSSKNIGATETLRIGYSKNFVTLLIVNGFKTASDTVTVVIHDKGLSGGQKNVTYTVQATDNLTTIASGIKSAINSDVSLQSLGLTATSAANVVALKSNSTFATSYDHFLSNGATEKLNFEVDQNELYRVGITGTCTANDVLTLYVYDKSLPSSKELVTYTVQASDSLVTVATAMTEAINSNANLQAAGIFATASSNVVTLFSNSTSATSYRQTSNAGASELLIAPVPTNGVQTGTLRGIPTANDTLTITVHDEGLTSGSESVSYVVQTGDDLNSIAAALGSQINANTNLQSIGVSADSINRVLNLTSVSLHATTYSQATSDGATESVSLSPIVGSTQYFCNNVNELTNTNSDGPIRIQATTSSALSSATTGDATLRLNSAAVDSTGYSSASTGSESVYFSATTNGLTFARLSGSTSAGDVVSLTIFNSGLSGGSTTKSYTVQPDDTLYTIADRVSRAINSDSSLKKVGITSVAVAEATFKWTKSFTGSANIEAGDNDVRVSAAEGTQNSVAAAYKIKANSGSAQSWIYDLVGNFGYGPTQGYSFDPENRFTQLDVYTPTPQKTYYQFDAFGRCVSITSWENDVEISHTLYVWSGNKIIQQLDAEGSVLKNFYGCGEASSNQKFFYTRDHLGSLRELTDESCNIRAQLAYEPYGRQTKLKGDLESSFQYAGYFFDNTSQFHLTPNRAYDAAHGRWVSRDPAGEQVSSNLSVYAVNNPVNFVDPSGLETYNLSNPTEYQQFLNDAGLPPNSDLGAGCLDVVNNALKTPVHQLPESTLDKAHTKCFFGSGGFKTARETGCCPGETPIVWGKYGFWVGVKPLDGTFLGHGGFGKWNNDGGYFDYAVFNAGKTFDMNHYKLTDPTKPQLGYANDLDRQGRPIPLIYPAQMWCRTCK